MIASSVKDPRSVSQVSVLLATIEGVRGWASLLVSQDSKAEEEDVVAAGATPHERLVQSLFCKLVDGFAIRIRE